MGSSSWFVFFKALFLETLHQNQLFEGTPLGLQSLSKILSSIYKPSMDQNRPLTFIFCFPK